MVQVPARSADQTLRFDEKPDEDALTYVKGICRG
jgi:hypothetical protein